MTLKTVQAKSKNGEYLKLSEFDHLFGLLSLNKKNLVNDNYSEHVVVIELEQVIPLAHFFSDSEIKSFKFEDEENRDFAEFTRSVIGEIKIEFELALINGTNSYEKHELIIDESEATDLAIFLTTVLLENQY